VVGVAQPVVVTFSKPVTDRAAAVQTVHITSSRCVTEHFDGSNDATTPSLPLTTNTTDSNMRGYR